MLTYHELLKSTSNTHSVGKNIRMLSQKIRLRQPFLRRLESRLQVSILCHSSFYWPQEEMKVLHALSVISDWQLVVILTSFHHRTFHLLLDHFHTHKGKGGGWKTMNKNSSGQSASSLKLLETKPPWLQSHWSYMPRPIQLRANRTS